jgi:hypothetical protein
MPRDYKKDKEDPLSHLSFETPACQDVSLGAEQFERWQLKVIEKKWQERNKTVQRRLHTCCSDSETVINPLPG